MLIQHTQTYVYTDNNQTSSSIMQSVNHLLIWIRPHGSIFIRNKQHTRNSKIKLIISTAKRIIRNKCQKNNKKQINEWIRNKISRWCVRVMLIVHPATRLRSWTWQLQLTIRITYWLDEQVIVIHSTQCTVNQSYNAQLTISHWPWHASDSFYLCLSWITLIT